MGRAALPGTRRLSSACPAGAPHLQPAGHRVPHAAFHAKMLLGSFPKNFSDFRITCMFPAGNCRALEVMRAVASLPTPRLS